MSFIYSATNLVTANTLKSTSSEDTLYIKDFLYGARPSRPFRFTGKSAEWVKVDMAAATPVTLVAVFNHNLTSGGTLAIEAAAADSWTGPTTPLTWREHDIYKKLSLNNRWYRITAADALNPAAYIQLGGLWLGTWVKFNQAHVQPEREDGLKFHTVEQETSYGQAWDAYLSENETFRIRVQILNDPDAIDEIQTFLSAIRGSAGRFVFIPDDKRPHVYLARIVGTPSAARLVYGDEAELKEWSIEIAGVTRGITLL